MKLPPRVTSVFATGCFVITGATIGAPLLEEEELLLELELLLEELEELELLLDEELEELELDELELDELLSIWKDGRRRFEMQAEDVRIYGE